MSENKMSARKRQFESENMIIFSPRIEVQLLMRRPRPYYGKQPNLDLKLSKPTSPMRAKFSISKLISQGSFGYVYKAIEKATNKIFALKKLKPENNEYGNWALRELEMGEKSQHPNVVKFIGIIQGLRPDSEFIIMEYVESNLSLLIKKKRENREVFITFEIRNLMKQLLSAVAHIHEKKIMHRDLKPSSLLMTTEGTLKVADFGLACEFNPELYGTYSTKVGTLEYRSPEMLTGDEHYSCSIDMWSIGCIFAELYLLQPLFYSLTDFQQLFAIFKCVGFPTETTWPEFFNRSLSEQIEIEPNWKPTIDKLVGGLVLTNLELNLMHELLRLDPHQRISAKLALESDFILEKYPAFTFYGQ